MCSSTLLLPRHLMGWVPTPHLGRFTPAKEARYPLHRRLGAENLVPTGIRFPNRPACRQSLYNCIVPAHIHGVDIRWNCTCTASVWSSVCRVSQRLGSVLQNVTRGVLLDHTGSGYMVVIVEVRRRGCILPCSCSEFVCSVTCISLRGLRRSRHCFCWMLAVLSTRLIPRSTCFRSWSPSTCEKRAPFHAERRVHRNVEEEDSVLPWYSGELRAIGRQRFPHAACSANESLKNLTCRRFASSHTRCTN